MKPCHSCLPVYYQGLQHALKQDEEKEGIRMKERVKINSEYTLSEKDVKRLCLEKSVKTKCLLLSVRSN